MKIETDVMIVLSKIETDGPAAKIIERLDPKLYARVNKVLEAIGGKWNRKAQAHLFEGRAAFLIDRAIIRGEVETSADVGFFETPQPLAAELVELADVHSGHHALEPSAGLGRIVLELQDAGAIVTAVEYDPARREHLASKVLKGRDILAAATDFLDMAPRRFGTRPSELELYDRVVMNPPFCKVGGGDHFDHVRHAFALLKPSGVLVSVLPAGLSFRQDQRHQIFRAWVLERGTIKPLPDGSFAKSGTNVSTVVVRLAK